MYNKEDYSPMGYETEERRPVRRRRPRKNRFFKKAAAMALSALLLGGIAGTAFYGTNAFLLKTVGGGDAGEGNGLSLASLSYSADEESQSLDVSRIAQQGLTSVVSVTNISVQEVQSYFGIFGRGGRGQMQLQETTSCGSGVIVFMGDPYLYIVTNYHVIEGASTLSVTFVDDQTYEAQVCGYDEEMDVALLKVSADDLSSDTLSRITAASMGDSDELVVGEQVVAIGNALGYGQSVTTGIVSALDRSVSSESGSSTYIQTDAAINPGNSGGALLNMDGELVGINTAKVSSTDVEGMGYAIPISQIKELIETFISETAQ